MTSASHPRAFYEREYGETRYCNCTHHPLLKDVSDFVTRYQLQSKRLVEIGCGRGAFQDIVADYTGTDLSETAGQHIHKRFVRADATRLPFAEAEFDALISVHTLEHIPDPEAALREMRRVVKPSGYIFLKPAWHCRWYVCHGIPVRPYGELAIVHWPIKALLPVLESRWFRGLTAIPRRLVHMLGRRNRLWWRRLPANFETFWCPDSDAIAYLDPVATMLWFERQGDHIVNCASGLKRLFVRAPALIVLRGEAKLAV